MSYCYVCGCQLNKFNETEEHIIQYSIGGVLKSKQLLCKQCNSMLGHDIDDELAKQFNCFANIWVFYKKVSLWKSI